MAIDFSSMLLNPSPTVRLSGGSPKGMGMERERLKLAREQFEDQKRAREEERALRALEEEGRNKREAAKIQAQQDAETQKARLEAQQTFLDRMTAGKLEEAQGLIPVMSALGMGVELEGEEGGMPRYRIDMDAQAAAEEQRQQARQQSTFGEGETAGQSLSRMGDGGGIGYEQAVGSMDTPAGISSSGQVDDSGLSVAERVASTYGDPGDKTPMAPPDTPDALGGVPSNVVDMGALQQQTLQRLKPALGSLVSAYPDARRQESARHTADAVSRLALPAADAVKQFSELRGLADPGITQEIGLEAQAEQQRQSRLEQAAAQRTTQQRLGDKDAYARYKTGFATMGKEVGAAYEADTRLKNMGLNDRAIATLTNKDPADDLQALALISRSFGERGASTENDASRALGIEAGGWVAQLKTWLSQGLGQGLAPEHKDALVEVLRQAQQENQVTFQVLSDRLLELVDDPETDADTSRGIRDYWRSVTPKAIREKATEAGRGKSRAGERGAPAGERAEFSPDGELEYLVDAEAAINGLNPAAIMDVIRRESGGNPAARNPQSGATGLIQFMPKTAENLGTTVEEISSMSVEDQVRLVTQYFENSGITADSPPEDYPVAVAAPAFVGKPDDTVVYPKDSKAWEQNKSWRPAGGGDITVGSIKAAYARKSGKRAKAGGEGPPLPPPEQMTPEQRRERIAALKRQLGR